MYPVHNLSITCMKNRSLSVCSSEKKQHFGDLYNVDYIRTERMSVTNVGLLVFVDPQFTWATFRSHQFTFVKMEPEYRKFPALSKFMIVYYAYVPHVWWKNMTSCGFTRTADLVYLSALDRRDFARP